jgi:hypothetical protein
MDRPLSAATSVNAAPIVSRLWRRPALTCTERVRLGDHEPATGSNCGKVVRKELRPWPEVPCRRLVPPLSRALTELAGRRPIRAVRATTRHSMRGVVIKDSGGTGASWDIATRRQHRTGRRRLTQAGAVEYRTLDTRRCGEAPGVGVRDRSRPVVGNRMGGRGDIVAKSWLGEELLCDDSVPLGTSVGGRWSGVVPPSAKFATHNSNTDKSSTSRVDSKVISQFIAGRAPPVDDVGRDVAGHAPRTP